MSGPPTTAHKSPTASELIIEHISSNPAFAQFFKDIPELYGFELIRIAVDKAIPPKPIMCAICNLKPLMPGSSKYCSKECEQNFDSRCMFCCEELPDKSLVEDDAGKFCNDKCHHNHNKWGGGHRQCICGGYVNQNNIKMYVNGHVYCSDKCKKVHEANIAKSKLSSSFHYIGFPWGMHGGVSGTHPVGARDGTKITM
jgi:hypothetical protein